MNPLDYRLSFLICWIWLRFLLEKDTKSLYSRVIKKLPRFILGCFGFSTFLKFIFKITMDLWFFMKINFLNTLKSLRFWIIGSKTITIIFSKIRLKIWKTDNLVVNWWCYTSVKKSISWNTNKIEDHIPKHVFLRSYNDFCSQTTVRALQGI